MAVMTSKERVQAAIHHEEGDRVPFDYDANENIDAELKRHFGLARDDEPGLRRRLGVDILRVNPRYIGPVIHAPVADRQIDPFGARRRWVEHGSGGYWDCCDFPLKDADLATVEAWPFPNPDHFDFVGYRSDCEKFKDFAVTYGHPAVGDGMNCMGAVRTMERIYLDLGEGDEAGLHLIQRKFAFDAELMDRSLTAAKGLVDLVWIGEDLGTQIAPIISMRTWRRHLRPLHQRLIDVATKHGVPVMLHSCGASSWVFDDLAEMGVRAVDTLQPEARGMAPAGLKERWGSKLAFHGCISTAGPVSFGTPEDVRKEVRDTLAIMKPGGGYMMAPTHCLQDNSPLENVLAMYEAAHQYGSYRASAG